jgi:NAD(P)-dependent dehydrogenase (short-subunit alcohol dehydrogenase family)
MPDGESIAEVAIRLFDQMLRVNVLAAFSVVRAVLPTMQAQRSGSIINVSGRSRAPGSLLDATKMAIETLTIGLANELRLQGIAVNCLRPVGFIDTPGVLLNREVKPSDVTPPHSYLDAAVMMATQTAASYSGQLKTDAEVIRDLCDASLLHHYKSMNPKAWGESLAPW